MFEIVIFLTTKIEQLLVTLEPLTGIAVAEYVTEQAMYSSLHFHWLNIAIIAGICGIAMTLVGIFFDQKNKGDTDWPGGLFCFGMTVIAFSILFSAIFFSHAQINLVNEATPTLQLLKHIF